MFANFSLPPSFPAHNPSTRKATYPPPISIITFSTMEFTANNTATVPLGLAPPSSIGGENDDILSARDVEEPEASWSFMPHSSIGETPHGSEGLDDEEGRASLFYRVLTGSVMPFFLLLQWVLEVRDDDDDDVTYDLGWGVLAANVAIFCALSFFYHKAVQHNVWALLAPVLFLALADTLVAFHFATAAFGVMAGGLLGMAGTVAYDYFKKRRTSYVEEISFSSEQRELLLNDFYHDTSML